MTPVLGRSFTAEEASVGGPKVVILSHGLWVRRYAADPNIIGRTIMVDSESATVVGVLPAGFRVPGSRAGLLLPLPLDREKLASGRFLRVIGKRRPGVSNEQAQADMTVVAEEVRRLRPNYNAKWGVFVQDLTEGAVGRLRTPLLVLFGAVGFVLLIACANMSNLALVRAPGRGRKLAVRASLTARSPCACRSPATAIGRLLLSGRCSSGSANSQECRPTGRRIFCP